MFFKSDIQTEAIELIFCLYSLRFRDQECADKKIKIRANFCREEKKRDSNSDLLLQMQIKERESQRSLRSLNFTSKTRTSSCLENN